MLSTSLLLFGLFAVSVVMIFVLTIVAGVSISRNPLSKLTGTPTWTAIISYLFMLIFVLAANVGWWGGWITLVIWGVQTLA